MSRVLLTGGSGFIAAHILDKLLAKGYSVVTTVRSQEKADKIKEAHPDVSKDKLDFAIVEDIAQEGAFDKAVIADPPFDIVLHTASPFHFNITDTKRDLLDPAIIGTTGILKAIKRSAPTVKRVVITSSFAAILSTETLTDTSHIFSEADWNTVTEAQTVNNPANGYRGSKTFAERAAWAFLADESPNFTLATINPPMVFGPVVHYLGSLSALNTSNQRIRNFLSPPPGDATIPDTGVHLWVDVRDVADAHIRAAELPQAANKRFLVTQGYYSNKQIVAVLRKNFPADAENLPAEDATGGDFPPEGLYKFDNSRSVEVLGMKYRGLDECIVDTAKSLKAVGA